MNIKNNKRLLVISFTLMLCLAILVGTVWKLGESKPTLGSAGDPYVIVVDPGHGGMDSGAVGIDGLIEKNINLNIALTLKDMLGANGFKAVLTRETDTSIHDSSAKTVRQQKQSDMKNRLQIINDYDHSIAVSIHQNKFPQPEPHGAQMFYSDGNEQNFALATTMQKKFVEYLQPENVREVKPSGDELYLTHNAKSPSLMIECGFVSNPNEAALLKTDEYQRKVAFTIFSGLCQFIADSKTSAEPNET